MAPPTWDTTLPLPPAGTTPPPTTGCPDGFAGVNCHACEEDTYSGGCTEHCNAYTTCAGNGRCRGKDGTCICDEGWTGAGCSIPTSVTTPPRTTGWVATPPPTSGWGTTPLPIPVCPDGFAGVNCHACEEDTYSGGCTAQCKASTTCAGNGRCRGKDGTCICDEGWTGANCNGEGSGSMSGSDMHPTCACGKHGRCEADGSCVCESGFFDRRFCGFVLSLRCVVAGAPRDERDQVSADHACVIRFRRAEM